MSSVFYSFAVKYISNWRRGCPAFEQTRPPKNDVCQVCIKLAQWRRSRKCKDLQTDRRIMGNGRSEKLIWAFNSGDLKRFEIKCVLTMNRNIPEYRFYWTVLVSTTNKTWLLLEPLWYHPLYFTMQRLSIGRKKPTPYESSIPYMFSVFYLLTRLAKTSMLIHIRATIYWGSFYL
jgi:hypothetical protein